MNKKIKLLIITICFTSNILSSEQHRDLDTIGVSFFKNRSQGSNTARRDMGIISYIYPFNTCDFNGAFSIIPEYTRSFSRNDIAKYLFFNGKDTMQFATSVQPGTDVAPINFLLNDDFKGTIKANPRVQNGLIDFNLFLGLDFWLQGLYFQAFAPLCWTQWAINFEEQKETEGTVIAANQLGNPTDTKAPNSSIIEAWNGTKTFFDVNQPMNFAKVNGKQSEFRVADLEIVLGYTVISCPESHLGFNLRTIVPAGNASKGEFFFEPMVGNGHHVELGAGINGHLELYRCGQNQIVGFIDGTIYHMFKNQQRRTFDLKINGKGSRYLLFKRFNSMNDYAGEILRGPNILTRNANVDVAIHADATFMLEYSHKNVVFDIGYNLWGRSPENITDIEPIQEKTFGIKGNTSTEPQQPSTRNTTASLTEISGENANIFDPLPVFISTQSLDPESAEAPGAFSHKLFFYCGYSPIKNDINPFFGLGLEAEFSGRDNNALRQVGILIKTGCSF